MGGEDDGAATDEGNTAPKAHVAEQQDEARRALKGGEEGGEERGRGGEATGGEGARREGELED